MPRDKKGQPNWAALKYENSFEIEVEHRTAPVQAVNYREQWD
jgi:hypothetical protein